MNQQKILKLSKGFYGRSKNNIKLARTRVEKGLQHQYRDRKLKKRDARKLWITNVNAASREQGVSYSAFVDGAKMLDIGLNRKALAELAQTEPYSFASVVELTKKYAGK